MSWFSSCRVWSVRFIQAERKGTTIRYRLNVSVAEEAMSVFIAIIGNLLGKARPNWFAGIRTPWTLSSDRSWDVTHRWAARLFMAAGVVSLIGLWATGEQIGWIVMLVAISIAALVPVGMSYFIWRNDPDKETYSAD